MTVRSLPCLLALSFSASLAVAQGPAVRLTEVTKDSARFGVRLEVPGTVELEYGEELFAWEGRAESLDLANEHELHVSKLLPNRTYFYRLLVDGIDAGEVLTFRTGRSWIDRNALILVTADTPSGASEEQALGDLLFAEQAGAILALGGDGGDPGGFRALHGRAQGELLVVETGGTGDVDALRSLAVSDVAIASVGENPLLLPDGSAAPAATWLATALPAIEGACWSVVASAREISPDSTEAETLVAWARSAGVQVLLTRAPRAALVERDGVAWLALPDPAGEGERAFGRIESAAATLTVKLVDASGVLLAQASLARRCPIPASLLSQASFEGDGEDELFGDSSSDDGGDPQDCDY